jgi:hypothetical protein
MTDSHILDAINKPVEQKPSLFAEAYDQLPSAAGQWAKDVMDHKLQFAAKTAVTAAESAVVGGALGYMVPGEGKAAAVIGTLMMAPVAYGIGKNVLEAEDAAAKPGADVKAIGHKLAYYAIDGSVSLAASFAGGYGGFRIGSKMAMGPGEAPITSRSTSISDGKPVHTAGEITGKITPLNTELATGIKPVAADVLASGALKAEAPSGADLNSILGTDHADVNFKPAPPIPEGPPGILTSLDGVPKSEVTVTGKISKVLPDDTKGLPHQQFLVELPNGKNIFVANDTTYGTAVPDLAVGQPITIKGEWIPQPGSKAGVETQGVLHWTHKGDGPGLHQGGYIDYGGNRYQLVGMQELSAENIAGTLNQVKVTPLDSFLRPAEVNAPATDTGGLTDIAKSLKITKLTDITDGTAADFTAQPQRGHGGGDHGGNRGGNGDAPGPVKDGPPGVLTKLDGVPRSEVTVAGKVSKILPDDTKGLPHQRFLVELDDGTNVFIANDTHYGTAVPDMQVGQPIQIRGEWIPEVGNWGGTDTIGVLHWTHKADAGSNHPPGWIDYGGNRYQLVGMQPEPDSDFTPRGS